MNPPEILSEVWAGLERAVVDRRHPWHLAILATCDPKGFPQMRTVVLRAVDAALAELNCHTDVRSPKCREIIARPEISWLLYSPADKVQLRLRGLARLHYGNEKARSAWEKTKPSSRRCYLTTVPPGENLDPESPALPPHLRHLSPSLYESEDGWQNFAVVSTGITEIDWLHLNATGHERFLFRRDSCGQWSAEEIAA